MRSEVVTLVVFAAALSFGSYAAAYSDPKTFTVENASGEPLATYTISQLKSEFPIQTYDTRTPWTDDGATRIYRGPRLEDVLAKHDLTESPSVRIIAYDDFVSDIRHEEITAYVPILAIELGCTEDDRAARRCKPDQEFRPIMMKEKGPIFLVWPLDDLPAAYTPARNSIWVWFPVAVRPAQ